jgi:hypothetical protein
MEVAKEEKNRSTTEDKMKEKSKEKPEENKNLSTTNYPLKSSRPEGTA